MARFDLDSFGEILASLSRNRSRTFLTGFGIFWGLFMLLFLTGGGAGLKALLSKNFEGFATNTAIVWGNTTSKPYKGLREGRMWSLTYKDMDRLRMMVPELDIVTPVVSRWGGTAMRGGQYASCSIAGTRSDYAFIETPELEYGRYINEVDVNGKRKVCVIGKQVYNNLFPEGGDPCGQFIEVDGVHFRVVGVNFAAGNININGNQDTKVTIPISIAQQLYMRGNTVDIICVTGKNGIRMSSLEGKIRQVMSREHLFDPTDTQAMMYFNTEQLFNVIDNLFRSVNFLVWLVGLGTLLAGAIGVSNIMLVTVRERTTEIGIRRAIGATPGNILLQIILESVTLTAVAGCASILFSVGVLSLLDAIVKHQVTFQLGFGTAVTAVVLIAFLGIAAGLLPALRAMNIKPVDAMRDE